MKEAFAQGNFVTYKGAGVCKVERIEEKRFSVGGESRRYYVLNPVDGRNSTVYVPVDHPDLLARMRSVLSRGEIDTLLDESRGAALPWVTDRKQRDAEYRKILSDGMEKELLLMVRCINRKKVEMTRDNKKLPVSDEAALRRGETLVREEFAFSLGIDENDVPDYIRQALGDEPDPSLA